MLDVVMFRFSVETMELMMMKAASMVEKEH